MRLRSLAMGGVCGISLAVASGASPQPGLPPFLAPTAADRILIVAPHPDDETLCCAGLLQQALRNGAQVAVVWVTEGDGFEIDAIVVERTLHPKGRRLLNLGVQRMAEARAAATLLGVPRVHQYFLGYPDRGVRALFDANYRSAFRSRYTGAAAVPYGDALHPGSAYTGANIERDLSEVIDAFKPTLVFAAAPQDRHGDHATSGMFVRRVLEQRGQLQRLRYWIVHAGDWPRPRGLHPQLPLAPPAIAASLQWQALPLDATAREQKRLALMKQHSQMEVMAPFLRSFVRSNELFALPGQ